MSVRQGTTRGDASTGRVAKPIAASALRARTFLGYALVLLLLLAAAPAMAQSADGAPTMGWVSILPPVVAIGLALLLRQVMIALLCGVWLGATLLSGGNALTGLLRTLDTYLIGALADKDHAYVVIFSLLLGGMVGIIGKSGGTAGLVAKLTRRCRTARSTQTTGWLMGMLLFFDDYANSLLVGPSMRPLCDRMRISREKLSFIVDSTAAPVASLAVVSTWIGFEVGLVGDAFRSIGLDVNAYWLVIASIPYRFYAFVALALVLMTALLRRDAGSMHTAEIRARTTGKVLREGAQPLADFDKLEQDPTAAGPPYYAWAPVAIFLMVTLGGLFADGAAALGSASAPLYQIIGAASPFRSLLWGAFAAVATALLLPLLRRTMKLQAALDAFLSGVQSMNIAVVILLLAWSLGQVCKDMGTAQAVVGWIEPVLAPHLLPAVVFVTAAAISFATGTSWGTMAILMPIAVPAAHHLLGPELIHGQFAPHIAHLGTIGAVLTGSIFGDHCSPISDTTILSSMCSGADHIDHVQTQLPYALMAALIALVTGYIPAGFGISPWICIPAGLGAGWLWLRLVGKPVPEAT